MATSPLTLVMALDVDASQLPALQKVVATAQAEINAALTSVGTVHFARVLVLDTSSPNLQFTATPAGPFALAVITEYDGDFARYTQDFVNKIGDVFDMLLKFTVGGSALVPVTDNVAAFTAFVAANDLSQQPPNDGGNRLYSAYPQTVQQILAKFPPAAAPVPA
ncbi:MAG: hypothetical protein Q8O56_15100 [Solirubrobacteraceae bacterium]|nr:hypothetical protein [Solirubrobacteraceae bacterium]